MASDAPRMPSTVREAIWEAVAEAYIFGCSRNSVKREAGACWDEAERRYKDVRDVPKGGSL